MEVRQLACIVSGNRLQRRKKGPWSLGESRAVVMHLGGGGWGEGKVWAERALISFCFCHSNRCVVIPKYGLIAFHWWLMKLSIFSYAYFAIHISSLVMMIPSIYHIIGEVSLQIVCPFFIGLFSEFYFRVFICTGYRSFIRYVLWSIFSQAAA